MPKIFNDLTVQVYGPNNTEMTLQPNPIQSYRFHPIPAGVEKIKTDGLDVDFVHWQRTYRWATDDKPPRDNIDELNA